MKFLIQKIRREIRNWDLCRRNEGLRLDGSVSALGCTFGRHNMVCGRTVISTTSMGDYSYIGVNGRIAGTSIGKFCSIGPNVSIAPGKHPTNFVSTHPIFYSMTFNCDSRFSTQQRFEEAVGVEIGHDVWIGNRVTILDGVKVGTGAIIAAHSVVNKDVEPYSIVGGAPARHIRYRFPAKKVSMLLKTKWWDQEDGFFRAHVDLFASDTGFDQLMQILASMKGESDPS